MKKYDCFNIALFDRKIITFICMSCVFIYLGGMQLCALVTKSTFANVSFFDFAKLPLPSFLWAGLYALVFLSGSLMLYFLPGWMILLSFSYKKITFEIFSGLAFAISFAGNILISRIFLLIFDTPLERSYLVYSVVLFLIAASLLMWREKPQSIKPSIYLGTWKSTLPYLSMLLYFVAIVCLLHNQSVIFHSLPHLSLDETTVLNIPLGEQTDVTEVLGLAESLKTNILPYWDLEYADRFGYVLMDPPLHAFMTHFSLLLFGWSMPSCSLNSLLFIFLTFCIVLANARHKQLLAFINSLLFAALIYYFRGQEFFFVSIDILCAFALIASISYLLNRQYKMFYIFAFLLAFIRDYGVFFILPCLLGVFIYMKDRRTEIVKVIWGYLIILSMYAIFFVSLGYFTGDLSVYVQVYLVEHFDRIDWLNWLNKLYPGKVIYWNKPSLMNGFVFLGKSFTITLGTLASLLWWTNDKKDNVISFLAFIFFGFLFLNRFQCEIYLLYAFFLVILPFNIKVGKYKVA